MKLMLDHIDSPYIRCTGFLYLRYAADPSIIWKWFKPYLYDEEPVKIRANVSCKETTVGHFVRALLTDLDYHGTRLPRLPIADEREIKDKLFEEEQIEERAQRHLKDRTVMELFERVGSKVQARYGDEENEVTWYDAVVDRVMRKDDESGIEFFRPKFMVTFPEYGNTEIVALGDMDVLGVDHSVLANPRASGRDISYSSGGNGRRDDRGHNSYDNDGRRNDRDHDRNGYRDQRNDRRNIDNDSRRGHGSGQSLHPSRGGGGYDNRDRDSYTRRDRSRSRDRTLPDSSRRSGQGSRREDGHGHGGNHRSRGDSAGRGNNADTAANSPTRKTPQELATIAEKKSKLLAKYG